MSRYAVRTFEAATVFEADTETEAWVTAGDIVCGYDWDNDGSVGYSLLQMPAGTPVGHIDFVRADELGRYLGCGAVSVEASN